MVRHRLRLLEPRRMRALPRNLPQAPLQEEQQVLSRFGTVRVLTVMSLLGIAAAKAAGTTGTAKAPATTAHNAGAVTSRFYSFIVLTSVCK